MKVHFMVAALPPFIDGIGDYTANLARQVATVLGPGRVKIYAGQPASSPIEGVEIEGCFSAARRASVTAVLKSVVQDEPDWLVLEYSPFSFGKHGLNPFLPLIIWRLRKQCPRLKLALMIHEPFTGLGSCKEAVMTMWQRPQLWALGQAADVIFCSITAWKERFSRWFRRRPVLHLPVSSNIPLETLSHGCARERIGIPKTTLLFGLFGTARHHAMLGWIRRSLEDLANKGREVAVLYIGPHREFIGKALPHTKLFSDGELPPAEVSRRLAGVDIYLAPFVDGASTRRTSLMTGLQHGLPVVTTRGRLTDSMLERAAERSFLMADADAEESWGREVNRLVSDVPLRVELGVSARMFFDENFSWRRIAGTMLAALSQAAGGAFE